MVPKGSHALQEALKETHERVALIHLYLLMRVMVLTLKCAQQALLQDQEGAPVWSDNCIETYMILWQLFNIQD